MQKMEEAQRSRGGQFAKKVMDDQATNLAALLAWGTLTAVLPLILGLLSLVGLILRDPQRLNEVYSTLLAVLPPEMANQLGGLLDAVRQESAGPAAIVALVLLLVNGANFFSNMAFVYDRAYHVEPRNFLVERLIAVGMLIVTAVLLVLSTTAAGLVSVVDNLPGSLPIGPGLARVLGWSVTIVSVFVMFLLVYRVLPNARQGWRDVVPGTLLAMVLALVISQVFPLYVKLFPPNQAYALFGVFLVITFWLYLTGLVFVLGAELNAFLQQPARSIALAEATSAAERGRAEYSQAPGQLVAQSTGEAPDATARSPRNPAPAHRPEEAAAPRATLAGRILGFVGLIFAVIMLRGQTNRRAAA